MANGGLIQGPETSGDLTVRFKIKLRWGCGAYAPPVSCWGLRQVASLLEASQWDTPGIEECPNLSPLIGSDSNDVHLYGEGSSPSSLLFT